MLADSLIVAQWDPFWTSDFSNSKDKFVLFQGAEFVAARKEIRKQERDRGERERSLFFYLIFSLEFISFHLFSTLPKVFSSYHNWGYITAEPPFRVDADYPQSSHYSLCLLWKPAPLWTILIGLFTSCSILQIPCLQEMSQSLFILCSQTSQTGESGVITFEWIHQRINESSFLRTCIWKLSRKH